MDPVKESTHCYVNGTLLTDAMVTDCGHSFSEAALREIFDKAIGDIEPRCPIAKCNELLTTYFPNRALRKLMQQVDEASSHIKTNGKRPLEIPLTSAVVKTRGLEPQFPGKPAQFVHFARSNWNKVDTSACIKRMVFFESRDKDSLFTSFKLDQCADGAIRIWVWYKENHPGLADYFAYHGVDVNADHIGYGWHVTESAEQLKLLFALVAKDNEIPVGHYNYLRQIVENANF